jgi:hypothetical protein
MSSKIREILLKADVLISIATFEDGVKMDEVNKIRSEIKAALAEPIRNYEVGTAEEQYYRHDEYCNMKKECKKCYTDDALFACISCFARWSQMPYESEVK